MPSNSDFAYTPLPTATQTPAQNAVVATNTIAQYLGTIVNNLTTTSLFGGAFTTSYAVLYTANSSVPSHVDSITFANTTGAAITVSMSLVAPGGTASAANAIFFGYSIAANTTFPYTGRIIIPAGYTLQGLASATGLVVNIAGGKST